MSYGRKGKCLYSIGRRVLNELLLTKAKQVPGITLHFEHKLSQASLENKSLVFQVGTTDPKEVTVKTDFIFGCDGAHSTVRRQMMRWGRLNYSQEYIEHGYKELTLPPMENGDYALELNVSHIWARQEFMILAHPNLNHTFTLTLFMPFKGGRVMIAFFVNYSTVTFPLHLPTLKRQQFFGAVASSLGKKFIFPATVGRAALCGANR